MKIGETVCKSIINTSGIEGVDYAVNPYIGCSHACTYCYARFMTRWYHPGEKWGTFVDVKKNALECIKNEASRKKRGVILFSSVTDAYQSIEKKTKLTRSLLQVLRDHDLPIQILTKSSLVARDIDVIGEFTQSEVGLTIISLDEKLRKAFEPGASPVSERLDTLEKLRDAGVSTYAFLGPLLPYLSEEELEVLLNNLADKVGSVIVDRLNIKAGNWKNIQETIEIYYPDVLPKFKKASKKNSVYYSDLRKKVKSMLEERAIPYDIVY
ncbi:radical SAM protein [Thermoproteota archaeon]